MVSTIAPIKEKLARPLQSPPKRRISWKKVAALVGCQVLAVLFVEGVLLCAGLGEEEIFHFDKQIGFTHIPNKRVTWRTEGFASSYYNADGMREPNLTIEKPANTYRVAVLGDSMVEGLQVPVEKTFGEIISKRLSPLDGKQVQFLNFAVSGYSTVQEYLQIKRQVLKYKPDLVIVSYNSRDLFENWTPPDQVITNVRPYALQLPGRKLVIADLPVRRWMRSLRGQFMVNTAWLRENSRIAGLLTALDLEWSQHNPWYRALIELFSHPQKAVNELMTAIDSMQKSGPSFQIKFFEDSPQSAKPQPVPGKALDHVFISASSNSALAENPMIKAQAAAAPAAAPAPAQKKTEMTLAQKGHEKYKQLTQNTYESLLIATKEDLQETGAQLAVLALPVRAQLCPLPGMDTNFAGLDYNDELKLVEAVCKKMDVPFCNVEKNAETLPLESREKLYYAVHLNADGQKFIADAAQPFVRRLLAKPAK